MPSARGASTPCILWVVFCLLFSFITGGLCLRCRLRCMPRRRTSFITSLGLHVPFVYRHVGNPMSRFLTYVLVCMMPYAHIAEHTMYARNMYVCKYFEVCMHTVHLGADDLGYVMSVCVPACSTNIHTLDASSRSKVPACIRSIVLHPWVVDIVRAEH